MATGEVVSVATPPTGVTNVTGVNISNSTLLPSSTNSSRPLWFHKFRGGAKHDVILKTSNPIICFVSKNKMVILVLSGLVLAAFAFRCYYKSRKKYTYQINE